MGDNVLKRHQPKSSRSWLVSLAFGTKALVPSYLDGLPVADQIGYDAPHSWSFLVYEWCFLIHEYNDLHQSH